MLFVACCSIVVWMDTGMDNYIVTSQHTARCCRFLTIVPLVVGPFELQVWVDGHVGLVQVDGLVESPQQVLHQVPDILERKMFLALIINQLLE
jgi:hypothetical protein